MEKVAHNDETLTSVCLNLHLGCKEDFDEKVSKLLENLKNNHTVTELHLKQITPPEHKFADCGSWIEVLMKR